MRLLLLAMAALAGACSTVPPRPGGTVTVTVQYWQRAVATLDVAAIPGSRTVAIIQGGEQHALVRPGAWPGQAPQAASGHGPIRVEERITLHFGFDRSGLSTQEIERLSAFLAPVQPQSIIAVTVEGHADAVGTRRYNLGLSERRARAVARRLALLGVPRDKIRARGFGEDRPAVSNADPAGRAANRRAEVRIHRELLP
ncbi:OmpA family protein [Methylococcus capsulatus]|uniref:OmpA family protein n=1 Tax=Methylococcus capsulatus TaxID=414 RepID=UPI001C530B51|nr:OmpA family protein [Methylococcus capsulatus]QXP89486.1 OmpA family protein [Methylococcus capsulatus]